MEVAVKLLNPVRRCARCRYPIQGDGHRHEGKVFCSKSCCEIFILDQINRQASEFRSPLLIMALAILVASLVFALWPTRSWAQHHHDYHKDFYQHWKVPGEPDKSCCNARITHPNGAETGDCEPTKAEIRNGFWWAWVRQKGEWVKIPDDKIVRYPNPNIFEAHHCWTFQKGTICFKPPDLGG